MSTAEPLYFGSETRPLFGWLHQPAGAAAGAFGLVLCNPFGYEAICAHRTIRHIAESAAAAGIPALRFDYDGTGDSAGSTLDADRPSAWIDSVNAAARFLRESTGVQHICAFGIRLGATLAAMAATRSTDIDTLIAVAPITNVKAYLRELRMLQMSMDSRRQVKRDNPDGVLESGGFMLTPQTQEALNAINLCRGPTPAVKRALILDRAELPIGEEWSQRLLNAGARVEQRKFSGYAEMMLDSHETVVPDEMIATAIEWLAQAGSELGSVPEAASVPTGAKTVVLHPNTRLDIAADGAPEVSIRETIVHIGPQPGLFGIISAPLPDAHRFARPVKAILLLNSGAVHHIGPNRLYVAMARRWARLGHVVLRMDLSGIGDSAPRPGQPENVVYANTAPEDVRLAIEYLKRECQAAEVHAVGLCSGAYHAFKAAVSGAPLAGVVLINPLTFFWKEGMSLDYPEHRVAADIMRYRTNMWRPASWLKLLSGRVNLWELSQVLLRRARALALGPIRTLARIIGRPFPDDLEAELHRTARASVKMRFVFAAQDPGVELLRSMGGATARKLQERGAIDVDMIDGADHTFTDRAARAKLAAALARRLDSPDPLKLAS